MRAFKLYTATAALVWCQPASSGALPPATGPYHVGLQKHVVPVLNEADPFWPNNVSTSFLVNVFYPTQQEPEPRDWERPYLDPVTARLYEQQFNLTAGSLSTIKSPGLIPDAKPLDYYHHYPDSGSSPCR
ncbi:Platelet-activating factor acetylhydrolase [Apiospora kogelbergensis]|uniref:Platelet-activating factor acetylhydrolase n=1 Tax=Apiospora kogelbergensis TaxID=1337665 RepID=A0AAW0QIU9_9PEZI